MTPDEINKLDAFFKRTFSDDISVRARPKIQDSLEVYNGDEFLGVLSLDDEDGDRSFSFSMAILDIDLEDE